jgi:protein-S-isoprenylcysteine O-methyltransferase Ste14
MSLAPAFEIGLWNAWILVVLLFAAATVPLYTGKEKTEKRCEGEPSGRELEITTRIAHAVTHLIIMPFTLIYSVFLPLKLGTFWFLAGLPIYLLALGMVLLATISFSVAPLGEPLTKGLYAISRHPWYLGLFLGFVGTGVACASWVFLLCALVWIVSWHFGVIEEERILLERYGEAYREYIHRTPRWIGLPKAE